MPDRLPVVTVSLALALAAAGAGAHDVLSLEELPFLPDDMSAVEIDVETLAPGLHVLRAVGGAVLVSTGDQGVLIVDDQFPDLLPKLVATIRDLGGGDVDFAVNTHWHFDHADSNPQLGAGGTWIAAHINSRRKMTDSTLIRFPEFSYEQPPYPAEGLPVITFDASMHFHFNGQRVDLMHFGPAHTTGDAAVWFRRDNVIHMGDIYSAGYPFIDAANGGSLAGMIAFCRGVLATIDDETRVVSGHSPLATRADLEAYTDMLETVHARLTALLDRGYTLAEALAAAPTADYDATRGDSTLLVTMAWETLAE